MEKDLKEIMNKNKNIHSHNFENSKSFFINKKKYFSPLFNYENRANFKYLKTESDTFLNKNKMKLVKNQNKNNTITLMNKNSNNNHSTHIFFPNNMLRKVVYVDQNNKTLSNDKTLNLLKEEKDYLNDNLLDILLSYYIDDKGNGINGLNLPLLIQHYNNNPRLKEILSQFDRYKLFKHNNNIESKTKGKLSKLIEDRFTMNNYKNMPPKTLKSTLADFNYHSIYSYNYENDSNNNLNSNFNNYNFEKSNTNNIFRKIITNSNNNNSSSTKKRKKDKNKDNAFNDILGLINSKVIESPNKKQKLEDISKIEEEEDNNEEENKNTNKFMRSFLRANSRMENVLTGFNLTNKLFRDDNKNNSSLYVKDANGNMVKINFKQKKKNGLAPINEGGKEIQDMRMLKSIYEKMKQQLNIDIEKTIFHRRYSYDIKAHYKNPLMLLFHQGDNAEVKKKKDKNEKKNNNNIIMNKLNEEKEKKEKNKKLISELQNLEKKQQNHRKSSKSIKIKAKQSSKKIIIKSPSKNKNLSPIKNVNENLNTNIKEPEIDPKIKELLNDIKNNPQNESTTYNEEYDFIKDINFDFYSSGEETEAVTLQKKMRYIRKKKNKYLFSIFTFISKNTDFSKEFTKGDLIKYLINDEFRFNFQQLKEQIAKGRILSYNCLNPRGFGLDNKIFIKDLEIINYLYRYIEDKDSIFYKAIYHPKKDKNKDELKDNNNEALNNMLDKNKNDELKKKRRYSVLYRRPTKEYSEDKFKSPKKIKEKKKKPVNSDEIITQSEKKLLILNEINLTNELKYQISISNDKESREKFKNLLNKIESLRNLDSNEYVKCLKRNYEMYKEEVNEIIKAKQIEDRLNGFLDCLNYQRNNLKDKHKYNMSLLNVKDNKFSSTFENNIN